MGLETIKRQTRAAYGCLVAGQSVDADLAYGLQVVRPLCHCLWHKKRHCSCGMWPVALYKWYTPSLYKFTPIDWSSDVLTAQWWLITGRPADDATLLTDMRLELLSRRDDDAANCAMLDTVRFMSFCGVFFSDRARLTRFPNLRRQKTDNQCWNEIGKLNFPIKSVARWRWLGHHTVQLENTNTMARLTANRLSRAGRRVIEKHGSSQIKSEFFYVAKITGVATKFTVAKQIYEKLKQNIWKWLVVQVCL